MRNCLNRVLMVLMAYIVAVAGVSAQNGNNGAVSIKAKLDSATLLMGNVSLLHLQIVQDAGDVGILLAPQDKLMTDTIEVSDGYAPADTIAISDARIQIDKSFYVQSFDSGLYLIPSFKYVVGRDTFSSNDLVLKVLPVELDSLTTINDYKGVVAPEFNMFDYLPSVYEYWYIYMAILLAVLVGLWFYFRKRVEAVVAAKEAVVIPPYEEAMMKLNSLKEQQLWQAGRDKEYYTELTDILRNYLERRFGIYAMEMTSSQIIKVVKENEQTRDFNQNIQQILETADFVKFAKVRPLPEDNERSLRNAIGFVEETKPKAIEHESVDNKKDVDSNNVAENSDVANQNK